MEGPDTATATLLPRPSSTTASSAHRTVRFETGAPRAPGRRLRRRLPRRRDDAAVGHHGRQAPEGAVRLLPADDRRRGADVRRRAHPRLVLPPRGPPEHRRDPHLPADRPPAAPDLRQGAAQRGPGRHHRAVAQPRGPLRRRRDQRRLDVDAAVRPAVLRPDRRRARRADRRPVGRLPPLQPARAGRLRHGRRRPRRHRAGRQLRRRDHDGRGRGHRLLLGARHRAGRAGPDRGGRRAGPGGGQAVHRRALPRPGRPGRARRQADPRVPGLPGLRAGRATTPSRRRPRPTSRRRSPSAARPSARPAPTR